jgi:hypothetical protein
MRRKSLWEGSFGITADSVSGYDSVAGSSIANRGKVTHDTANFGDQGQGQRRDGVGPA